VPGVDGQPDPADQPGAMGDDEPAAVVAVSSGKVGWWFRPPWNKKKDRPSVLDAERLMRRHREQIRRFLSKWAGTERKTKGDAA
jgi:hypothetical protein